MLMCGWPACKHHTVESLCLERRRHVREPGDLVLLGDLLQQRRVGFAGEHFGPTGPLETAQMPLSDAADANDKNPGFHAQGITTTTAATSKF